MPGATALRYATNTATTNSITSDSIWSGWNSGYSTLTTGYYTPVTESSLIWSSWCSGSANTATIADYSINIRDAMMTVRTHDDVWGAWCQNWQPTSARVYGFPAVHAPRRELTPEEQAAREAERLAREAEWKAQEAERLRARENAKKLLLSVLNEDQKKDWAAHGHFFLHVGDRKYRIKRGRSGNVELVDPKTHEPLERYCAHPVQNVPDEDTAVAQMMYLLHDEQRFIGLANVHYTKPGFPSQKRRAA